MVAVRVRQFGDRQPARLLAWCVAGFGIRRGLAGDARQLLQQGQRLQLQRVKIERVAFQRH